MQNIIAIPGLGLTGYVDRDILATAILLRLDHVHAIDFAATMSATHSLDHAEVARYALVAKHCIVNDIEP